jgi:hypothetical protein
MWDRKVSALNRANHANLNDQKLRTGRITGSIVDWSSPQRSSLVAKWPFPWSLKVGMFRNVPHHRELCEINSWIPQAGLRSSNLDADPDRRASGNTIEHINYSAICTNQCIQPRWTPLSHNSPAFSANDSAASSHIIVHSDHWYSRAQTVASAERNKRMPKYRKCAMIDVKSQTTKSRIARSVASSHFVSETLHKMSRNIMFKSFEDFRRGLMRICYLHRRYDHSME